MYVDLNGKRYEFSSKHAVAGSLTAGIVVAGLIGWILVRAPSSVASAPSTVVSVPSYRPAVNATVPRDDGFHDACAERLRVDAQGRYVDFFGQLCVTTPEEDQAALDAMARKYGYK